MGKKVIKSYTTTFHVSIYYLLRQMVTLFEEAAPSLKGHHKAVTLFSFFTAQTMNLSDLEIKNLILASIIHDLGIFFLKKSDEYAPTIDHLVKAELNAVETAHSNILSGDGIYDHSKIGFEILKNIKRLNKLAPIVLYHHAFPKKKIPKEVGEDIIRLSSILHLSDLAVRSITSGEPILYQAKRIRREILTYKDYFPEDVFEAFMETIKRDDLWLDIVMTEDWESLLSDSIGTIEFLTLDELIAIFRIIAKLIDARSPFTSSHTKHVVATTAFLSKGFGFSKLETRRLIFSAWIHDIGKIAVPLYILHKRGKLSDLEFATMKEHVYRPFSMFYSNPSLRYIVFWASMHHERLDGSGYPWGYTAADLDTPSRIIQVADVYAALREVRPYRKALTHQESVRILEKEAKAGKLDKTLVDILAAYSKENIPGFEDINVG